MSGVYGVILIGCLTCGLMISAVWIALLGYELFSLLNSHSGDP